MNHPYKNIPDAQRWSRAMAHRASADIDPVTPPPFRIGADTRVVTAGSCFAQHVARHLREQGHACFETEPAHPLLPDEVAAAFNYGIYAARYGNIYTARQLLQLWRRATGAFEPADDMWKGAKGWFDPFRPTIQPDGFASPREYREDRRQHFAAVRRAFTDMDVFVFTLGLTECWASREDGAVYPLCPGVAAGEFDAGKHRLLNFSVDEVAADLSAFIGELRQVNPHLRVILTVSPVPLAATAEPQHVLTATTYSKAALRVAAEQACKLPDVYYFPSYEIVNAAGLGYFSGDRRSVSEQGVRHVMSLFFRHLMEQPVAGPPVSPSRDDFLQQTWAVMDTLCDEQRLDPSPAAKFEHDRLGGEDDH
ncbi:MAG: GSCFA domain-containing protein [Rhodanobacter sp.]